MYAVSSDRHLNLRILLSRRARAPDQDSELLDHALRLSSLKCLRLLMQQGFKATPGHLRNVDLRIAQDKALGYGVKERIEALAMFRERSSRAEQKGRK